MRAPCAASLRAGLSPFKAMLYCSFLGNAGTTLRFSRLLLSGRPHLDKLTKPFCICSQPKSRRRVFQVLIYNEQQQQHLSARVRHIMETHEILNGPLIVIASEKKVSLSNLLPGQILPEGEYVPFKLMFCLGGSLVLLIHNYRDDWK